MTVSARTPYFCQEALIKELREITRDMEFMAPKTKERRPLQIHCQMLPVPPPDGAEITEYDTIEYIDQQEQDNVLKAPWACVKIERGATEGPNAPRRVKFNIIVGVFDDRLENEGHKDILNIFSRIESRFCRNHMLDRQYECTGEFDWELNEEDCYPYHFGMMSLWFRMPGIRREAGIETFI